MIELRRGADFGMQMMIDDFGRGETSLSVLRKLPLSGVKLDKSLLPIDDDERAWDFVRGAVGLVRNFSGRLIAEGIEDAISVHEATGLGAWAAGSASRLPGLADALPDYIESVTILVDGDDAGRRHGARLAAKLRKRGIEVRTITPGVSRNAA